MKFTRFAILVLTFSGLSGCAIIGPSRVPRDRFDYINAISESWKSQTLLNLVKIRYGDAPVAPLVRIFSSPQPLRDVFAVVS